MNDGDIGVFDELGRRWLSSVPTIAMRQFARGLSEYKGRITVVSADGRWVYNQGRMDLSEPAPGFDDSASQEPVVAKLPPGWDPFKPQSFPQRGAEDPFCGDDDAPLPAGTRELPLEIAADYAGVTNHYSERY